MTIPTIIRAFANCCDMRGVGAGAHALESPAARFASQTGGHGTRPRQPPRQHGRYSCNHVDGYKGPMIDLLGGGGHGDDA